MVEHRISLGTIGDFILLEQNDGRTTIRSLTAMRLEEFIFSAKSSEYSCDMNPGLHGSALLPIYAIQDGESARYWEECTRDREEKRQFWQRRKQDECFYRCWHNTVYPERYTLSKRNHMQKETRKSDNIRPGHLVDTCLFESMLTS